MIRLTVATTADAAADTAATRVAAAVRTAQEERGSAHVSLSGGSAPLRAYELLGPKLDDPGNVDIWFGDERAVPPNDPDSNYRFVAESLLHGSPIPLERIHRIECERLAPDAAEAYAAELRRHVPAETAAGIPALDVALLGLGEDGHTASLFPGDPALDLHGELCVPVGAAEPSPLRITLTLDVLRAARQVVILATGGSRAEAVRAVLAGPDKAYPASLLTDAELVADAAAAGLVLQPCA